MQTIFVIQNVSVCMLSIYLLKGICFEKPLERHQQELCLLLFVADWPLLAGSWALLGRSWVLFGRSWGPKLRPKMASEAILFRKSEFTKSIGKPNENQCFWPQDGSENEPRWPQDRSKTPLGLSCPLLGRSWAGLGPLLAALGCSWALLAAFLPLLRAYAHTHTGQPAPT